MGLLDKMSPDQESAIRANIAKAVGRELMFRFPDIAHVMKFPDAYTRDLNFLILLEEICNSQEINMRHDF